MEEMPGGALNKRPLHFFWIVDCSGSMAGEKMGSVNHAISNALPVMRDTAAENPHADVLVRALKFSSGASWHIIQPTPVPRFEWKPLQASGVTDMGRAFSMLANELRIPPMSDRALPPVIVLLSDGQPTDDYANGLKALMEQPWGAKAVRIAIAIGHDADSNVLQRFIGNPEITPLLANNAETLTDYIRWASTAVVKAASAPASQSAGMTSTTNVTIPAPPPAKITAAADW